MVTWNSINHTNCCDYKEQNIKNVAYESSLGNILKNHETLLKLSLNC